MSQSLPFQRVLIVRLGAIGDVINATVLASALKDLDPGLEIGWAVHEAARPIVEGHPSIDRVHLFPRKGGLRGFWRTVRECKACDYEVALDAQRLIKSAGLARLCGARRSIGFGKDRSKELSAWVTKEHLDPAHAGRHRVDQYLEFIRHLGLPVEAPRFELPHHPSAEAWAEKRVESLDAPPVLINLGASKPENRWSPNRFGELARKLRQADAAPVLLVGGPEDRPAGVRAMSMARAQHGVESLVGETDLHQLAALQRRCALFVSCDTGPMHLAAAAGARVLALFGPADPEVTGPYGARHRILEAPAPPGARASMESMDVEQVLATALECLALK